MVLTFLDIYKIIVGTERKSFRNKRNEKGNRCFDIQSNYTCMTNHILFLLVTKDLNEVTLLLRQLLTTSQPRSPDTPSCFVGTPDSQRSTRRATLVLPSTSLGTSFHVAEKRLIILLFSLREGN